VLLGLYTVFVLLGLFVHGVCVARFVCTRSLCC
jgi:hypothetical protein